MDRRVPTGRRALLLLLVALLGAAAACGGEVVSPAPEDVQGTFALPTTAETTPAGGGEAAGEGDPAAGKAAFTESCGVCHTLADAGTGGSVGPNLDSSTLDYEAVRQQVLNGSGAMPPFQGVLTDQQINDVSAYVVQARSG